jgi:hypothetical protein
VGGATSTTTAGGAGATTTTAAGAVGGNQATTSTTSTTSTTAAGGGSGFTSDGSGEIAGGPPRIADTGAEAMLAPAAVLAALSLSLASLVRRSR